MTPPRPRAPQGRQREMTQAEYAAYVDRQMSETVFQDQVMQLARVLGWWVYHPYDSRRSKSGWPDLVLVHRAHGVLYRELKTEVGRVSPEQREVIALLTAAGANAAVWRPRDKTSGLIENELRGRA